MPVALLFVKRSLSKVQPKLMQYIGFLLEAEQPSEKIYPHKMHSTKNEKIKEKKRKEKSISISHNWSTSIPILRDGDSMTRRQW